MEISYLQLELNYGGTQYLFQILKINYYSDVLSHVTNLKTFDQLYFALNQYLHYFSLNLAFLLFCKNAFAQGYLQYQYQLDFSKIVSKYYKLMIKSFIYLVLLSVVFGQLASEGTEGYFVSPHGISRQREVHDALQKIVNRLTIDNTTYNHSGITYVAYNFTLQYAYIDSKQTINIAGNDQVQVSGGKVEIQYVFNFSKTQSGRVTQGYATGSVVSDSFNYTKALTFDVQGHLSWQLIAGDRGYKNLTIFNRMKIKRLQPFNETDMSNLEDILDRAVVQINPGTVQKQILDKFNSIMPQTLNTTLNSYVLGPEIMYTFNHPTKGKLDMTIVHHLFNFTITPEDGYKVIYLSEIKDWPEPVCDGVTVPYKHLSWDFYGGTQNIHMTCLYQEVVQFMQKKGWLDTRLDTSWDCNAFQFYAGDLYDMINNLYTNVSPLELIEGQCKASPNNLSIKHGRDFQNNVYALSVTYQCTGKSRDRSLKSIDILNFTADVRFIIQPKAQKITLDFSVVAVDVINLEFRPVGNYYVTNINLALFKAHEVMRKMVGSKVFGTGFPSLPKEHPSTEVQQNFTVYYDVSQKGSINTLEEL